MPDYEVKVVLRNDLDQKYEDIPAGVKFYFKLEKIRDYFLRLVYYSYAEGDLNGRIVRRNC